MDERRDDAPLPPHVLKEQPLAVQPSGSAVKVFMKVFVLEPVKQPEVGNGYDAGRRSLVGKIFLFVAWLVLCFFVLLAAMLFMYALGPDVFADCSPRMC